MVASSCAKGFLFLRLLDGYPSWGKPDSVADHPEDIPIFDKIIFDTGTTNPRSCQGTAGLTTYFHKYLYAPGNRSAKAPAPQKKTPKAESPESVYSSAFGSRAVMALGFRPLALRHHLSVILPFRGLNFRLFIPFPEICQGKLAFCPASLPGKQKRGGSRIGLPPLFCFRNRYSQCESRSLLERNCKEP
jgi:hypothetical protein